MCIWGIWAAVIWISTKVGQVMAVANSVLSRMPWLAGSSASGVEPGMGTFTLLNKPLQAQHTTKAFDPAALKTV